MNKKWFKLCDKDMFIYPYKRATNIDEAWQKTMSKWRYIAKGYKALGSVETCGLCDLYNNTRSGDNYCLDCPIYKVTGHTLCDGTPINTLSDDYEEKVKAIIRFLTNIREGKIKPPETITHTY